MYWENYEIMELTQRNRRNKRMVWRAGYREFINGSFAFRGQTLGEPLGVSTVIIDHIVISHPLELLLLVRVQSLLWCEVRRSSNIEFVEGCNKWGFAPVCLDKSTSSRPIICIPILICISILANKYSSLDWNPQPVIKRKE